MSKNVKTQTPQSGIGPRRGNMFAETEYAKDIGWTLKRIGLYFVAAPLRGFTPPCCRATP